jgi:hypothetical protein
MIFLKSGLSKKGVEKFYISNGINKSISNFRETIPLKYIVPKYLDYFVIYYYSC